MGMPPIKSILAMWRIVQPVLEGISQLNGKEQSFGEPEIVEKVIGEKTIFVVVEKTAFVTREQAEKFIDVGEMIRSAKI